MTELRFIPCRCLYIIIFLIPHVQALPSKHEGVLQEKHTGDVRVWSAGTEVVGKYNFSGSAAGVSM